MFVPLCSHSIFNIDLYDKYLDPESPPMYQGLSEVDVTTSAILLAVLIPFFLVVLALASRWVTQIAKRRRIIVTEDAPKRAVDIVGATKGQGDSKLNDHVGSFHKRLSQELAVQPLPNSSGVARILTA
jgi:hypothetical protein